MTSLRVHCFFRFLGVFAVVGMLGSSLTGCAAWFQSKSPQAQDDMDTVERVATLADLAVFINSDQAAKMLRTEPLHRRVIALVQGHQGEFEASREVLLPVTQIMQGYILSEGHSTTQDKRSLVLIDPDRDAVLVVLVDLSGKTYQMLGKVFADLDSQTVAEMEEYANNWGLGQLGMAQ